MRSNPDFAREKVAALREALLSPSAEAIGASFPGLVEAASSIGGDDLESLRALQRELRSVAQLIRHGEKLLCLEPSEAQASPILVSVQG